jgi:hypothetical protein
MKNDFKNNYPTINKRSNKNPIYKDKI